MMRGKYVGGRRLQRLAWAWIEYIERDGISLDELYLAIREVVGEDQWPNERDIERMRPLWAEQDAE